MQKIIISVIFLFYLKASSQPVEVPQGVKYISASEQKNTFAKELIKFALAKEVFDTLFDEMCYVGPIFWKDYSKIDSISKIKEGNIVFNVPFFDSIIRKDTVEKLSGKLIQQKSDFDLIWNQVVKNNVPFRQIRKLNPSELRYYWSVIFYDIEEPVFVVEGLNEKILVQLDPKTNKIFWIDKVPN